MRTARYGNVRIEVVIGGGAAKNDVADVAPIADNCVPVRFEIRLSCSMYPNPPNPPNPNPLFKPHVVNPNCEKHCPKPPVPNPKALVPPFNGASAAEKATSSWAGGMARRVGSANRTGFWNTSWGSIRMS